MAWNYRKRMKIAPGVHLNFSKSGVSTSIGPKGAKISIGKRGTYLNTSIPGTGLYSRTKLSGNNNFQNTSSFMETNNGSNEKVKKGCRYGCGIWVLLACVGGVINIYQKPVAEMAKDHYADIWTLLIMLVLAYFLFRPLLKRKFGGEGGLASSFTSGTSEQTQYEYFLNKYNEAEKRVIEKTDREIRKAQIALEGTSDATKKLFLQSFIDHYKYEYISRLLNHSKYQEKDMSDDLDPLFAKAAEKVVTTQKYSSTAMWDWFGYNMDIDRTNRIADQLCECGIISRDFESSDYQIQVTNIQQLNRIIRRTNGHSLLSSEDKKQLNDYFAQRRQELIGEHTLFSELPSGHAINESYKSLQLAYTALSSCNSKWEIKSSVANTEAKAYANTIVDKQAIYVMYGDDFNFVRIDKDTNALHFKFKHGGMEFFIYPDFVIAAQSATNFDVIDIKNFAIEFKRQNFVETSNVLLPKDAKLVRYTYKYVNKNGERDARYSDNPRYAVYEYGDLTFKPYDLTMQFSNSEAVENFYRKFVTWQRGGKDYTDSNSGATEQYFNTANDVANQMNEFYDKIGRNRRIMQTIDRAITDGMGDVKAKLRNLFLADLIKCYEQLGHDSENMFTTEGLPMSLVEAHTLSDVKANYDTIQLPAFHSVVESLNKVNKTAKEALLQGKEEDFFYLNEVFKACGTHDLSVQYFSLLYRLFSVIAKSDNNITAEESRWLEKLMAYSTSKKDYGLEAFEQKASITEKQTKEEQTRQAKDDTNPLEELKTLIGLSEVKSEVAALANFVKIQQEREKKGMKSVGLSYHCVFTGNPGTGKTTVARILAAIYRDLGILKKGHLVETDRSGLVAEYVGQTAVKTNKIIDSALDGVLFIDEAYSLVQGGGNDYGQEAISTLLKRMEDDRDRLIVVLAGYSEDMKRFIDSNPGLQSRFNRYIHFADYSADELKQIFMLNVEKNQYKLDEDGQALLTQILNFATEHKDKNFGNGRYVRNLFEKTIQNQAMRLSSQPNITAEALSLLKVEDLPTNK